MSGLKNRFRIGAIMLAALLLLSAAAAAATSYPFTTLTTDSVKMRRTASPNAVVLDTLAKDAEVEVTGESGSYYKVKYNGKTGYILKEFISTDSSVVVTPTPEPVEVVSSYPYTTVTRESVNLRAKKSIRSTLLKKIPQGAEISVESASGTWAEVTYGKYTGYVKSEYIVLKTVQKQKAVKATATPTPVPTLSPEEDASGYIVLQEGDSGNEVKALQEALIELGFLTGTADGKFGSATKNAVIQLQLKNDYPTTGIVDANLQAFLYSGKPKNSSGTATSVKAVSPASGASIKKGNSGDAVGELQILLKELGYYKGDITFTYDTATQKAVRSFQKKNGLTADGVAGQATRELLASGTALSYSATATPTPTPTPTPMPEWTVPDTTIKLNSEGSDAKAVQQRLKDLGYYKGRIDGKFGRTSVNALKKFQEANGLKADGIAGKDTYAALFSFEAVGIGGTPTPAAEETATPGPDAVTTAETSGNTGTLRKGDGGDAVALLQEELIRLGYLSGSADGNYGEKTAAAVKAFQKANGLQVDGSAGPETLNRIYSSEAAAAPTAKPTATPAAPAAAATETLRRGDSGSAVKNLQSRLKELGYLSGSADGIYGVQTFKAVVAFQKANSLSADGIAGKATQSAMNSSSAVSGTSGSSSTSSDDSTSTTATAVTPVTTVAGSQTAKPSASSVIYANWYTTVKAVARKYPYATIYDYSTGISWQVHIFSLGAHADYEPLTASDTAKMLRVFGGNTWNPRAVWVIFSDGNVYMASTHSVPHDVQHITNNNFAGHSCLHFPRTQEQVEAIGRYATSHQTTIDAGWAKTQSMVN